nr:MAG TPA: hypothetical protein [Caudoviricetes sp.]
MSAPAAAPALTTLTTRLACGPALLSNPPQDYPGPHPAPARGRLRRVKGK